MFLTIFTPVFNRGHLVRRVYDSLCRQQSFGFEWLVINDGSTDETDDVLKDIIGHHELPFEINYISRGNRGLMRTINQALDLAKGELFCRVDSDDYAKDNLVSSIQKYWPSIADDYQICSLAFLSQDEHSQTVGYHPFADLQRCNFTDYRSRFGGVGDRNEVMKTAVFRLFKFPEFEGEKFCPEGLVWNRIARKYDALYVPEAIYVKESTSDSITADIYRYLRRNADGVTLYYIEIVKDKSQPVKYRWINAVKYYRYSTVSKRACAKEMPVSFALTAYPVGLIVRLYDKIKNKK